MYSKIPNNWMRIVVLVSSVGVESDSVREGFRQDWNDCTQGSPQVWGELGHICSFTFKPSTCAFHKVHGFPARENSQNWWTDGRSRRDQRRSSTWSSRTLFTFKILPPLNVIHLHVHVCKVASRATVGLSCSAMWLWHKMNEKDGKMLHWPCQVLPSLVDLTISRPVGIPPHNCSSSYCFVFNLMTWLAQKQQTWRHPCCSFQKQKAKDFKSQIIRYLEAMLQSQQRVNTQPLTFLLNVLCVCFSQFSYFWNDFHITYHSIFNKCVFVLQLIKFWEAFLPEAKAIA